MGLKTEPRDYVKDYESHWKSIVENTDGSINKEQVMKELSDFSMLIEHLSTLYCLATGNKVSYPTVKAEVVYGIFEEELQEAYETGYNDAKDDFGVEDENEETVESTK